MRKFQVYKNLKIIVTGSTGFKGSWLCLWLSSLNAKVIGIALRPEKSSIIFNKMKLGNKIKQIYLDINNFQKLNEVIKKEKPDIIFHLAAQSIVSLSFSQPLQTMNTNIIGSANILEVVRINKIKNLVYITSDKCYLNDDRSTAYYENDILGGEDPYSGSKDKCYLNDDRSTAYYENDILGGEDPYSGSKASAELIFQSYFKSYFNFKKKLSYATTRAGNVIGGGDMKKDRIVPDVIKSLQNKTPLFIRNPHATRPWQHVLEPLSGYLTLGSLLINQKLSKSTKPNWNFGPGTSSCKTVLEVVKKIISLWGTKKKIHIIKNTKFKEAKLLMLSSKKAKKELNWSPRLSFDETIQMTVDWYKSLFYKEKIEEVTIDQIEYFLSK